MDIKLYNGTKMENVNDNTIKIFNIKRKDSGFYIFKKYLEQGNYILKYEIENLKGFKLFMKHSKMKTTFNNKIIGRFKCLSPRLECAGFV